MKNSSPGIAKLISLVAKFLFPKACARTANPEEHRPPGLCAQRSCTPLNEFEAAKDPVQTTAIASFAPDPYDATKCDMCGQRKQSVRSRKMITVGASSGTARWKFCNECVVRISLHRMPKPPSDADLLMFFNVEDNSQVLVRPQNAVAKDYLEQTVPADTARWIGGALVIKETFALSLVRKLLEARFNIVGDRAIVNQMPGLYVHEGEWNMYTGGHAISLKLVDHILKGVGSRN